MKKNLISIVILALLIINIVLSAITLFSVSSTNRKTAALVTDIAAAINLDLGVETEEQNESVSMADVVTYDITEVTIPLKKDEGDDKSHVGVLNITLSMNSKNKDYKTYGDLSTRESLIKGEINDVVSQYTFSQAGDGSCNHEMEDQILERIQTMFDSEFIYDITISSSFYQ